MIDYWILKGDRFCLSEGMEVRSRSGRLCLIAFKAKAITTKLKFFIMEFYQGGKCYSSSFFTEKSD